MTGVQSLWNKIWRKVLAPEIDPRTLDDRLRAVKSALPPPVIWLLGKAQSGKTSLVHAMTGSSRAEAIVQHRRIDFGRKHFPPDFVPQRLDACHRSRP